MMPFTVMTATLFCDLLFSSMHSSSRGPTSRDEPNPSDRRPPRKVRALATNWVRLPNRLNNNTTNKMMEAIIQPRLLRGLGGGGGVMIGGADKGGGGGLGPGENGMESIMGAN